MPAAGICKCGLLSHPAHLSAHRSRLYSPSIVAKRQWLDSAYRCSLLLQEYHFCFYERACLLYLQSISGTNVIKFAAAVTILLVAGCARFIQAYR